MRLHGRRRLPLPDLPGRQRRRARELDERVAGGVARPARRVVPVLRRHQLLLRVRGGRRLQDARRLQGAQAQPDRADGAVPGLRRPAPGLRALPRQPQRHDHAAAGHVQGGRARPARGGSGWWSWPTRASTPPRASPRACSTATATSSRSPCARRPRGSSRGCSTTRATGRAPPAPSRSRAASRRRRSTSRARTAKGAGSWCR